MVQDGMSPTEWHDQEEAQGTEGTREKQSESPNWKYKVETVTEYLFVNVH